MPVWGLICKRLESAIANMLTQCIIYIEPAKVRPHTFYYISATEGAK